MPRALAVDSDRVGGGVLSTRSVHPQPVFDVAGEHECRCRFPVGPRVEVGRRRSGRRLRVQSSPRRIGRYLWPSHRPWRAGRGAVGAHSLGRGPGPVRATQTFGPQRVASDAVCIRSKPYRGVERTAGACPVERHRDVADLGVHPSVRTSLVIGQVARECDVGSVGEEVGVPVAGFVAGAGGGEGFLALRISVWDFIEE